MEAIEIKLPRVWNYDAAKDSWCAVYDNAGRRYFWNTNNDATSWTPPPIYGKSLLFELKSNTLFRSRQNSCN